MFGKCDCGALYVLGADDHDGERGMCFDCAAQEEIYDAMEWRAWVEMCADAGEDQ